MAQIRADIGGLSTGARRGAAIADELAATDAGLGVVAHGAPAAGPVRAVAAIGETCARWSAALGSLGAAVALLHTNLAAAAEAYAMTDEQAIDP
jgi:hypothetical protein